MAIKEINTFEDVQLLVNEFYAKVQQDHLIGPIFNAQIKDKWPIHLEKMYRFWQTVLLDTHTYSGAPFAPHAFLPIGKEHFEKWLALFKETVSEHFEGTKADEAIWRAERMAEMFQHKINFIKNHKPL